MSFDQTYQKVSEFYDEHSGVQIKKGIHIRHKCIINFLKQEKIPKTAKILEIGCGIGTVTNLLAKHFNKGKIVAVDISPKSIEIARKINNKFNNIEFIVSDMQNFTYPIKFDLIVMADVLEHIPIEHHYNLMNTINKHNHLDSIIGINIPHPVFQSWAVENNKENLQIIDQLISLKHIAELSEKFGLYVNTLKNYSLFMNVDDYQWITLKYIPKKYDPVLKSKIRLKLQQIFGKIFCL